MNWRRPLDIPLNRDGSARFLPWIIALMVYLAALAVTGALVLERALERWDRSLAGTVTVQLPPAGNAADGMAAALALLRATPGVRQVRPLDRAATLKLIEPWLGASLAPEELALPRLVDVRIDPGANIDWAALRDRLAKAAPGAVLDNHRLWLDRLAALAQSIEATALAIVALIGATAVLIVVFTTRTGLAVHHDLIELLHLTGARDGYIARQFEFEALRLGLRGGVVGIAFAALTILALGHAAAAASLGGPARLLPPVSLEPWHWGMLALLPAAASLTAMATARITVLRALARLP